LLRLNEHTKRNIIAYYSGWLSKPQIIGLEINDEDKNGFMMAVHKLDCKAGLDLILHTPGGDIASTQTIVNYLREMFENNIRAVVPQIAMSAGTIIACSCKQILMGKQSNLGPIDPHVRGVPAYGVIREFKQAVKEVKKDPASMAI
jgi:ClpP class serine protease